MSHFKKFDLQNIFTLSLQFIMWLSYFKALKNVEIKKNIEIIEKQVIFLLVYTFPVLFNLLDLEIFEAYIEY